MEFPPSHPHTSMKTLKTIIIALLTFSLRIFSPDDFQTEDLYGIWVNVGQENNYAIFEKKDAFVENMPGIHIMKDGILILRQNSGWCGTPPISYSHEKGKWEQTSDSTLTITHKYMGSKAATVWEIKELSENKLKVLATYRN